jgi:hypothetical protein
MSRVVTLLWHLKNVCLLQEIVECSDVSLHEDTCILECSDVRLHEDTCIVECSDVRLHEDTCILST